MGVGIECRRRHHDPRDRFAAPVIVANHVLDIIDTAKHRNIAYRLTAIGGRRGQHADRPEMLDRTALDPAQQDFGIGGAADHQRGQCSFGAGEAANTRIAEIAIAEAQRAQRKHLEKPVENDSYPAKEHRCLSAWRHENKNIIQNHQRERQNRRHAQDIEGIGQRDEAPLRRRQFEDVANHDAEHDEIRQHPQQQRQTGEEGVASLEAQVKTREQCKQWSPARHGSRSKDCVMSIA